ncbi:MAG: hypothetical protein K2K50_03195, partial [Anaeroplasmataceae bacterium]|nr:hypothetical protein [Anaeroplasmataceae bacterium]
ILIFILAMAGCSKPRQNYKDYQEINVEYKNCVRFTELVKKGEEFIVDVEKVLGEISYYTGEKDTQSHTYVRNTIKDYTYELFVLTNYNEYKVSQNKIVVNSLGNFEIIARVIWDKKISQMLWIGMVSCYDPNALEEIHSVDDLKAIKYNGQYILKNDIDLSSEEWEPLSKEKAFEGLLINPDGYTIYNLHSPALSSSKHINFGLFNGLSLAYIDGLKLCNVSLWNINEDFQYYSIGAIAGYSHFSAIKNCSVEGNIAGKNRVGGLVGGASESSFIKNIFIGNLENINPDVTSSYGKGGIVGVVDHAIQPIGSVVQQCYVKTNIKSDTCLGALCGYIEIPEQDCKMIDCHFASIY